MKRYHDIRKISWRFCTMFPVYCWNTLRVRFEMASSYHKRIASSWTIFLPVDPLTVCSGAGEEEKGGGCLQVGLEWTEEEISLRRPRLRGNNSKPLKLLTLPPVVTMCTGTTWVIWVMFYHWLISTDTRLENGHIAAHGFDIVLVIVGIYPSDCGVLSPVAWDWFGY